MPLLKIDSDGLQNVKMEFEPTVQTSNDMAHTGMLLTCNCVMLTIFFVFISVPNIGSFIVESLIFCLICRYTHRTDNNETPNYKKSLNLW